MHVLRRIVRRVREPLIIFTEYRDTLEAIRDEHRRPSTHHHASRRPDRARARHRYDAFTSGAADVMLATDAGSEGLNLQGTCRLVVNLELPWNPIRLEQRIGRVDRIGQARTVHAINLFAEGTAERTVLASLLRRIDRIRMSEIEIAACVIGRSEPPPRSVPAETSTRHRRSRHRGARRSAASRRHAALRRVRSKFARDVVPVTVVKSPRYVAHRVLSRSARDSAGRLIEDRLIPVRLPLDRAALPARAGERARWPKH